MKKRERGLGEDGSGFGLKEDWEEGGSKASSDCI